MTGKRSEQPPFVVRHLEKFLYRCGLFVADHHYAVLVGTLLFTAVCSAKILFTPQEDDIKTGYTPFGARSLVEMAAYNDFFVSRIDPVAVFVFIRAKDGGSMHNEERMREAVRVLNIVTQDVTHLGQAYDNFCTDFCLVNEPIRQYTNGLALGNNSVGGRIELNFPLMQVLGKQLDLSANFFGVHSENGTIKSLAIVGAMIRAEPPLNWTKEDVQAYERNISHFLHKQLNSPLVDAYGLSLTFTADEIVRTGMTIFPFIALGFIIMCVFSVITIYASSTYLNQPYKERFVMAVFGCVCPLLATSTALGLLFWGGFRFGTILCVTPFLVLAIGVDDAYLTIQSWIRLREKNVSHRERIAQVSVDVGPSVTITSLTNILAFLVGIYTPTPEIQLFCIGNVVAVFFDYVYQITMYIAIVSIFGKMENENESKKALEGAPTPKASSLELSRLLEMYADWVSNGFTFVMTAVGLGFYWWMAIHGAMSINILLSPGKLVLSDSPLIQMDQIRVTYVSPNYTTVTLFITKPGDLEDPVRLERVRSAVEAYEAYPECLGPQFSHFWLRDYEMFISDGGAEEEEMLDAADNRTSFDHAHMAPFLNWPEFHHWNAFIKFNEIGRINKFFATISYHGEQFGAFENRREILTRWRKTADEFTDVGAVVFDDNSPFVDQVDTILPATVSTSIATLLCMMVVCFLFMYNVYTVIVAALAICSICIGVFGLLSYWGIDLDPISMATTIMSIGFSVDFPAHITYHYFREGLEDADAGPPKRVARALIAIGFPLFQCGVSTILFVCCLLFVKTYMSEVFVKTMILVVSLGLLHGLLVVPVCLCAFSNLYSLFFTRPFDAQSTSSLARLIRWGVSPSNSNSKITPP